MHITSHHLRLALLRLVAEAGMRAGDRLSFAQLCERWLETGLRASDLRAVLHDMVEGGDLLRDEHDGTLSFVLSQCAYRELHRPDGELNRASPADDALLFEVRYRARQGRGENLMRREGDQAAVLGAAGKSAA
jgi:hypothetical protein